VTSSLRSQFAISNNPEGVPDEETFALSATIEEQSDQ
jgi:hypothetical protein